MLVFNGFNSSNNRLKKRKSSITRYNLFSKHNQELGNVELSIISNDYASTFSG